MRCFSRLARVHAPTGNPAAFSFSSTRSVLLANIGDSGARRQWTRSTVRRNAACTRGLELRRALILRLDVPSFQRRDAVRSHSQPVSRESVCLCQSTVA